MRHTGFGIALAVACVGCREKSSPAKATVIPSSFSETSAGRQFAAWLTVCNQGDRDKLAAYHREAFPYEVASADVADVDRETGLCQSTGGFQLVRPETTTQTRVSVLLKEQQSVQYARAVMEVDAAEPHRVVRFEIHPIETPPDLVSPAAVSAAANAVASPAGRQFAAWLAAFNAGDRTTLAAYHQQFFPYAVASSDVATIETESALRQGTGGFDLKSPESAGPTQFVGILEERNQYHFARAVMEVDAAEPHRVVKFEIAPIPPPPGLRSVPKTVPVDEASRRALVDGIASSLEAHYIDADTATQMIAALREHSAHGDYDKLVGADDLVAAITRDLVAVSHDRHLVVVLGGAPSGPPPTTEAQNEMLRSMNYGFGAIERLSGNVAHVVIDGFPGLPDDKAREGIAALMSQVADADALVIDLRTNHGGSPETVAFVASYVFDNVPVHLNDMQFRDTGKTIASWTLRDVPGKRFGGKKPVYVLTSSQTFSGGEELAYDLQALHRAQIVGETTGGGAHPVAPYEVGHQFTILVPMGRPINPITKTNWEGVGVKPDIAVKAAAALEEAHRRAVADAATAKH
jgi:hypothetical protein